jgi:cell division protein FtsB
MARHNLRFHRAALALTLGAILLMALPPARQLYAQQRSIAAEEAKLALLSEENARLEQRLARLQDPDYIEKLAREQLGMVRPGEISYVVVPPEASAPEPEPAKPKQVPWYKSFWNWLKDLAGAN